MKLLLIEDDFTAVKGIKDNYEDKGWNVEESDFTDAVNKISSYEPDIIVMDWMEDIDTDKDRGRSIFDQFNNKPVIIFSAAAKAITIDEELENPFIDKISKGNEEDVINKIDEWEKYLTVVDSVKNQFNDAVSFMMASLKPVIAMDSYPGDEVIKFMLNKQASEFFNSRLVDNESNPIWTQYLYPPLSHNLLVADILKSTTEEKYFVVLTPSCDMANRKVSETLVAACEPAENFYCPADFRNKEYDEVSATSVSSVSDKTDNKKSDDKKRAEKIKVIRTLLSYGYNKSKVALPCLPNVFPYLTINLKDLHFFKLSDISLNNMEKDKQNFKYYRIASVNSPYREQIVWAHMVNSCRPGVPERDYDSWAEDILK